MAEARANLSKRTKAEKILKVTSSKKSKLFKQEVSQSLLALNENTPDDVI